MNFVRRGDTTHYIKEQSRENPDDRSADTQALPQKADCYPEVVDGLRVQISLVLSPDVVRHETMDNAGLIVPSFDCDFL